MTTTMSASPETAASPPFGGDSTCASGRWRGLASGLRRVWFAYLAAAVAVVVSERVFWYYGRDPFGQFELIGFYALASSAMLWAIDRYRVRFDWRLLLVLPLFGYVVEGVITPIMYTGGPFVPFFPVWFAAWHGMLAVGVALFAFRRWLVRGERRPLLLGAVGLGTFWGTWAVQSGLPENLEDPELLADPRNVMELMSPTTFTGYAFATTGLLLVAHWLLGKGGWMTTFRPSRAAVALWWTVAGAMIVAWTVGLIWAAPMFAAYWLLQRWALRRSMPASADGGDADRPASLLEELAGPVRLQDLALLAPIAPIAAAVYAAWLAIDVPEAVVRAVFFYGVIAVQTLIGGWAMVYSLRRAFRFASVSSGSVSTGSVSTGV